MEGFENGDVIAHLSEVACAGKACRTGAYDADFLAVLFWQSSGLLFLGTVPVCNEAFETADGNGFAFDAEDAFAFALVFLWADAAADGWQAGVLFEAFGRFGKVAFCEGSDEVWNVYMDWAAFNAAWFGAVEAALGFGDGCFFAVAEGNFAEVGDADFCVLYGHVVSWCFAGHY